MNRNNHIAFALHKFVVITCCAGCLPDLTEDAARKEVISYYETEGEFAKTYKILSVDCLQLQDSSSGKDAHVTYHYCELQDCQRNIAAGWDQRIFQFDAAGTQWTINGMENKTSCEPAAGSVPELSSEDAKTKIAQFYETGGEWADKYKISQISCVKTEDVHGFKYAHAQYEYCAATGCTAAGRPDGSDSRKYDFVWKDAAWIPVFDNGQKSGNCN